MQFGYRDNSGLDLVRAVSALAVLAAHTEFWWNKGLGTPETHILRPFGFLAVEAFFVLSGILLGPILFNTAFKPGNLRIFVIRRWYRTLPLYYIALIAHWVVDAGGKGEYPLCYLAFCQSAVSPMPAFFSVSWSLSIEEYFYILAPILLFCMTTLRLSNLSSYRLALVVIIVASTLLRGYGLLDYVNWDSEIRKVVAFRLDAIAWGALLISLPTPRGAKLAAGLFVTATCALLTIDYMGQGPLALFALFSLLPPALYFLVVAVADTLRTQHPGIGWFAKLSYPLYLFHVPILIAFYTRGLTENIRYLGAYYAICIVAALIVHKVIERPVMNMRPAIQDA